MNRLYLFVPFDNNIAFVFEIFMTGGNTYIYYLCTVVLVSTS